MRTGGGTATAERPDVDIRAEAYCSALEVAVAGGWWEVRALLLDNGVRMKCGAGQNRTKPPPYGFSSISSVTCTDTACRWCRCFSNKTLLSTHGRIVRKRTRYNSIEYHDEVVKMWLGKGANINMESAGHYGDAPVACKQRSVLQQYTKWPTIRYMILCAFLALAVSIILC
jgi:hypothetical protein